MMNRTTGKSSFRRGKISPGVLLLSVLVLGAALGYRYWMGRKAPMPAAFAAATTLEDAMQQSRSTDQPVFVLATADWCAPCQALKRGAMSDSRIIEFIRSETIPVYLDTTESDSADTRAASRLGITGYPGMVVLDGDEVIAMRLGNAPAADLLAWLEASVTTAD